MELKACQQILATALKHESVSVQLSAIKDNGLMATFMLENDLRASVKLKTPFLKVLSEFTKNSQIIESGTSSFSGAGRISISSTYIDYKIFVNFDSNSLDEENIELELSGFSVNDPNNYSFWLSFEADGANLLQNVLEVKNGVVLLGCTSEPVRANLFQSTKNLFPSLNRIVSKSNIKEEDMLFLKADLDTFLLSTEHEGVFSLLSLVQALDLNKREKIKSLVALKSLPRICNFCRTKEPPVISVLQALPEYLRSMQLEHYQGQGCNICSHTGYLGTINLVSVLKIDHGLKNLLLSDASIEDVLKYCANINFETLLENGVRQVNSGLTTLSQVVANVSQSGGAFEDERDRVVYKIYKDLKCPVNNSADRYLDLLSKKPVTDDASSHRVVEEFIEQKIDNNYVEDSLFPESQDKFVSTRSSNFTAGLSQDNVASKPDVLKREKQEETKILIVEDDQDQQIILKTVFERAGYCVVQANNGEDGVDLAIEHNPSLILMDFMMPDMDGFEALKVLRANFNTEKIPVVVLTAYADSDVECNFLEAGANDFCPKSISKRVLLARVEKLIQDLKAK